MKIINLTAVSATFELENESIYYNKDKFDVFLDGKIVIKDEKRNVFTIFNLNPNTEYEIKALDKTIKFKTKSVKKSYIIRENGLKDYTEYIQKFIDEATDDSLITIEKGIYPFKYLKLILVLKGALSSPSRISLYCLYLNNVGLVIVI